MITSDFSFMSRLLASSSTVRDQLAQAQEQQASGLVSSTYSGLGNQARTALNLGPQIAHQTAWSHNVDAAQGRLGITQAAMSSMSSITSNILAQLSTFSANDATSTQILADKARTALQQFGDLLNSRSGDVYVFSGTDTDHPPIPNTDPTAMGTALLDPTTAPAPFSKTIGTTPTIEVGNGQSVQVGLLANQNTLMTSTGTTTGSYMRDAMTALAKIANLPNSSVQASDVASARSCLNSVIPAMAGEAGALGDVQSSLTRRQTDLSAMGTALQTQLSNTQEVDLAATITKVTALQTQLQASYKIIADARSMSLANYL